MIFAKSNRREGASSLRSAGDAARDARDWAAAVVHYGAYLGNSPDDAGIWVQLGNCAKEAGQYKTSFDAYTKAITLQPAVADTHLQLGHLCKLVGRLREARDHYRIALQLDGELADARQELASLQNTIASLPFLLPPTFLDFISAPTLLELQEICVNVDREDDPFRLYSGLLI